MGKIVKTLDEAILDLFKKEMKKGEKRIIKMYAEWLEMEFLSQSHLNMAKRGLEYGITSYAWYSPYSYFRPMIEWHKDKHFSIIGVYIIGESSLTQAKDIHTRQITGAGASFDQDYAGSVDLQSEYTTRRKIAQLINSWDNRAEVLTHPVTWIRENLLVRPDRYNDEYEYFIEYWQREQ